MMTGSIVIAEEAGGLRIPQADHAEVERAAREAVGVHCQEAGHPHGFPSIQGADLLDPGPPAYLTF